MESWTFLISSTVITNLVSFSWVVNIQHLVFNFAPSSSFHRRPKLHACWSFSLSSIMFLIFINQIWATILSSYLQVENEFHALGESSEQRARTRRWNLTLKCRQIKYLDATFKQSDSKHSFTSRTIWKHFMFQCTSELSKLNILECRKFSINKFWLTRCHFLAVNGRVGCKKVSVLRLCRAQPNKKIIVNAPL